MMDITWGMTGVTASFFSNEGNSGRKDEFKRI